MSFKFLPPRFGVVPSGDEGISSGFGPAQGAGAGAGSKQDLLSVERARKAAERAKSGSTIPTYGGKASVAREQQRQQSVTAAMKSRADAAYALLIQQVIAAQSLRNYVSDAKKAFESTDKIYAPVQYEERKKKYIEEYGKQLMRLANSIGRVTVEEKTYPGSFFDEQVVVRTLPAEYAELFRNPMVRAAAYDDFMSAIAKAQGEMGVEPKIVTDTKKFADAKYREAVDSGKGKWGAENLTKVSGAPASWEPVVIAAAKGEAFPRIEYLTSADQVREISPWLADAFRRRSSSKALKTIVGNYVADRLGLALGSTAATTGEIFAPGRTAAGTEMAEGGSVTPIPVAAADRGSFESARKQREEAARQRENARKTAQEARRRAAQAEADRQKAAAEGKAADEARLAKEKADAEQAMRDAEAKAAEAERRAREAEQKLREASGGAGGGGTMPPSGGGAGGTAPVVVDDGTGAPAIVVPDQAVVPPGTMPAVPAAPAGNMLPLLAVAALGIGAFVYFKNRQQ